MVTDDRRGLEPAAVLSAPDSAAAAAGVSQVVGTVTGAVLMTGASGGIGRATALALLRDPDQQLVVAGRGPVDDLAADLRAQSGNPNVHPLPCDLASLASIRAAVTDLSTRVDAGALPEIASVLAVAGIRSTVWGTAAARSTLDGVEVTFGTNVVGHYLLSRLLLDRLRRPGRLIFVPSARRAGRLRRLLGGGTPQWSGAAALTQPSVAARSIASVRAAHAAYATSGLALLYLVHEFARRVPDGVDVYSFDPGLVPGTRLGAPQHPLAQAAQRATVPVRRRVPGAFPVQRAGAALAQFAVGPKPSAELGAYLDLGTYLGRGTAATSARASYSTEREEELWAELAALVGLDDGQR